MSKRTILLLSTISLATVACGESPRRLVLQDGLSIEAGPGWLAEAGAARLVLRPSEGAARIDVGVTERRGYGVDRTPDVVLDAIAQQLDGLERVVSRTIATEPTTIATIDLEGRGRHRRHHAVFLRDSIVHVSCLDASLEACDAVAHSVQEVGR